MVYVLKPLESPNGAFYLLGFQTDVIVQGLNSFANNIKWVQNTIGQIIFVGFGIQKSFSILNRRPQQNLRNGNEYKKPVAIIQHAPIKKRTGRSSISIHKRVIVGQPKVQNNCPNDRVDKNLVMRVISEAA